MRKNVSRNIYTKQLRRAELRYFENLVMMMRARNLDSCNVVTKCFLTGMQTTRYLESLSISDSATYC